MKRSREPEEHLEPDSQQGHSERFTDSNVEIRHVSKITELDSAVTDEQDEFAMRCSLPPHKEPLGFRFYSDYEAHYQNFHTNRCLECRKNFPTEHLLGVHIEECHDPLAKYSCFVEGCDRKCMTPQKRRLHLIDKHLYPKNFFFAVTKDGIDGRRSLLHEGGHRRRSSSNAQPPKEIRLRASTQEPDISQQTSQPKPKLVPVDTKEDKAKPQKTDSAQKDTDMAELTGAMSALHFVPPSIRFGRGRAGFSKR
ncbi:Zinc finger protein [Cladobotryum mycophilum]|uniref:Zinc finger protein n=1 Tax=Cladobotryum mycophilum TaxID=491253 RepID=A0ABR0SEN6_9HYPO